MSARIAAHQPHIGAGKRSAQHASRLLVTVAALLLVVVGAGALTGCSSASEVAEQEASKASASANPKPDAQTQFLIDAAARHAAAIDLLDLTGDRPISDKLRAFAAQSRQQRSGQVLVLAAAVQKRGFTMPSLDNSTAGDGLITEAELDRIKALGDAEFEQSWVDQMVTLDQGVVAFVDAATASQDDPETAKVARELKASMKAELKALNGFAG